MVLELRNIDKSFGEKEVLKGVSFTAEVPISTPIISCSFLLIISVSKHCFQ